MTGASTIPNRKADLFTISQFGVAVKLADLTSIVSLLQSAGILVLHVGSIPPEDEDFVHRMCLSHNMLTS